MLSNAKEKMFYCVYIGNSNVANTARDVHWGVKQATRVQEEQFSLAIHNSFLSADRKEWKSQSNSRIHNRPL